MDYQKIGELFSKQEILPKYKYMRWIKIQDTNNGNYNSPIKYNAKTIADNLVDYQEGFIIVHGKVKSTTGTALQDTDVIGIKNGSYSIVSEFTVRLNNVEVDKNRYVFLTSTILNLLEYSDDYATSIATQYGFAKDSSSDTTSTGVALRKSIMQTDFANDEISVILQISLKDLSPFFRRLTFPIKNNAIDMEWSGRFVDCILRANTVQASKLSVSSTELYLPIVELPSKYEKDLFSKLGENFSKELTWDHLDVHEMSGWTKGRFDLEIAPSLNGVRKMYALAIPQASWIDQEHVDTVTDTTIKNLNVVIDTQDYFAQDISNDYEAYKLLQECANMGGLDPNTGTLISFIEFKKVYKIYALDLSHQRVFESDPRKSQAI